MLWCLGPIFGSVPELGIRVWASGSLLSSLSGPQFRINSEFHIPRLWISPLLYCIWTNVHFCKDTRHSPAQSRAILSLRDRQHHLPRITTIRKLFARILRLLEVVENIEVTYSIQDEDTYNFAKISFILGVISTGAFITG
jgi:hypothetical protein